MPVRALRTDEEVIAIPGEAIRQETPAQAVGRQFEERRPLGPSRGQQVLRGAISAASTAPAMLIPGGGVGGFISRTLAESLLPMAAETVMQQTGLAPESGADIAAAGLTPLAVRGALGLPGVLRGAARGGAGFVLPQQTRETGVQLARERIAGPSSRALFDFARRQGNVNTRPIVSTLDNIITSESKMSTPNKAAITILRNLKTKAEGTQSLGYDDLINEVQTLRQVAQSHFRRGSNVTAVRVSKAANEILEEMDKISPAIRAANAAYRKEQATLAITIELRKANPGIHIRNLLEGDDLVSGAVSSTERKEIIDLADRISRIGTGATMGAANRFIQAAAEPVAEAMQERGGRALMKILMQNPRDPTWVNRWGAIILAQFGRGAFGTVGEQPEQASPANAVGME